MDAEITPEPSEAEREAILAALGVDELPLSTPWLDPLGDDQEP